MARRLSLAAVLLTCGLTVIAGCNRVPPQASVAETEAEPAATTPQPSTAKAVVPSSAAPASSKDSAAPASAAKATQRHADYFREAVNRASSAVTLGQSAQSQDDWKLAASRWQQAITLMQQVPSDDPNYATAQTKTREYQQHLASAQQKANGVTSLTPNQPVAADDGRVASIPIVERWGGTPVVNVKMTGQNGSKTFNMLFDTGATGTLITPQMAQELGVVVVDQATVTIADGSQVTLPIGYLDAIEVGGLKKEVMLVAIGGDVGLLGQDVYGEYGISLGGSQINLYK